jgi:hypothetical protein
MFQLLAPQWLHAESRSSELSDLQFFLHAQSGPVSLTHYPPTNV